MKTSGVIATVCTAFAVGVAVGTNCGKELYERVKKAYNNEVNKKDSDKKEEKPEKETGSDKESKPANKENISDKK